MADVNDETTGGGEPSGSTDAPQGSEDASVSSSDANALTPEQRDEQTISRLLGGNVDVGKPAAAAPDPKPGDEDGDDSDAGDEATGTGEGDAEDELPEVTDEELEAILDALDDRLLAHPRIQKVLDERAKADADRRYEERRQAESVTQQSEQLIRQGRTAVEKIHGQFTKLQATLDAAARGDEIDESVKFNPDELMTELGKFGAAAVSEARRNTDTAFADAFVEGVGVGGVLTDEEKASVLKVVETANRIALDPKQGQAASMKYLMAENVKFIAQRAKAAGKAEAEAGFAKRRDALKKVVGENGTKAAVAQLANARKKLPTKPSATPSEATQPRSNMEAYKAAKAAGDHDRADEILAEMASAR